jgi:fumarate hydratase class I
MIRTCTYPFTEESVRSLAVGDLVRLSGILYTGRDRFHKFVHDGGACPVNLRDGALYHCGPVVVRTARGWDIRAAGPTTSMREERYMPALIEKLGIRLVIGKGGMGEATRAACKTFGCAYLHAVGGAACLLAQTMEEVVGVHFLEEFGAAEAVWEIRVRDFEAMVTIDAHGKSLHAEVEAASRQRLERIIGRTAGDG